MAGTCRNNAFLALLWLILLTMLLFSLNWMEEHQSLQMDGAPGELLDDPVEKEKQNRRLEVAYAASKKAWPTPQDFKPQVNVMFDAGAVSDEARKANISGRLIWLFCAEQWEECACYGKIRWGNQGAWQTIEPQSADFSNRVICKVGKQIGFPTLKDVRPGDDRKHCECQVNTASPFFDSINILALPKEERNLIPAREFSSCNRFEKDQTLAGKNLWEGVEGICNEGWTGKEHEKAGPRTIGRSKMVKLMKSVVNTKFVGNYDRFSKEGWLSRAFVSFFSGTLEGAQSQTMEILIESVHRFSVYPIVVLHAGLATPPHWTPTTYPRLILLNMHEMPPELGYSMTIMVAAVVSRVKTGIMLTYNSVVIPGVDACFARVEAEINEDYMYPILPVHFLDRKPEDGGAMWPRYCRESVCSGQTMRWNQMGLTWTHWALPLIGKTLRQLFRDETLPENLPHKSLQIRSLPDAEALLNVALWEAGATKQWCKIDIPDPSEVEAWLDLPHPKNQVADCGSSTVCAHLQGDNRFYPKGIPKVYAFLRYSADKQRSQSIMDRLRKKRKSKSLPPAIVYGNKLYSTGSQLLQEHPDMGCLPGI